MKVMTFRNAVHPTARNHICTWNISNAFSENMKATGQEGTISRFLQKLNRPLLTSEQLWAIDSARLNAALKSSQIAAFIAFEFHSIDINKQLLTLNIMSMV